MRPDILNPLFAEVEVLKGVGPQLAKPLKRLGLERVVDLLFHLPVSWIERKRVDRCSTRPMSGDRHRRADARSTTARAAGAGRSGSMRRMAPAIT
jgi:RecG-like helicase